MSYRLLILRRAQKELAGIPTPFFEKIRDSIRDLAKKPRPAGCQKLAGREGWRVRVGNYRVIYEINDTARTVMVLHIGHRRDVYR